MALFQGEDLVDVTAPDGRSYKLPASLAGGLQLPQQQQIVTPPQPSGVNPVAELPAPEPEIPSVTGGVIPPPTLEDTAAPTQTPPTEYLAATYNVSDAQGVAKQQAAQAKQEAKQQAAQAKQAASPTGQVAAADNKVQAAIGDQAEAVVKEADVEAAGHTMIADAYAQRNKDITDLAAKREAQARADLAAQDAKQAEIISMRDKIANQKIDRKADHPILGAIMVALAGLGSAIKGETANPAMEMLLKSIDRKVAGQMADLEQQKDVLGFTKEELTAMKEKAGSNLAFHNMLIAGESEKAARQVEEIVARTTSEKVKLEGAKTAALLREHGAEKTMEAVKFGVEYDQRERFQKQDMGFKYTSLAQADRHHGDDLQFQREKLAADTMAALAQERARGGDAAMKYRMEMQKELTQQGIKGKDGDYLLTSQGQAMVQKAAELDAEAENLRNLDAKSPDPKAREMAETRAQALQQKAAAMRDDARINYAVKARDGVQAGKLSEKYAAAQSTMTLIDEIVGLYDEHGRSWANTDAGRAALQSKMGTLGLALKDAWQLGAWDKGLAAKVNEIVGGDPSKVDGGTIAHALGMQVGQDPEAFKARLEAVAGDLKTSVTNDVIKNTTYDGKTPLDLFTRREKQKDTPESRAAKSFLADVTPTEREADINSRGVVRQSVSQAGRYFTGEATKTNEDVANEAANSGSLKYGNMTNGQAKQFDDLLAAYKKGSPEAAKRLLGLATDESNPTDAVTVLHALRDTNPDLYTQARQGLPKGGELDKQMLYEEKSDVGVTLTPLPLLVRQAVIDYDGDGAFKDLAKRAVSDPEAAKILPNVIKMRDNARAEQRFMGGIK